MIGFDSLQIKEKSGHLAAFLSMLYKVNQTYPAPQS
jgi:hypothetical protein